MAEALGLAASVIAVVELSAKLTKLCFLYSREVVGARGDIKRVQEKVVNLEALLQRLHDVLLSSHASSAIDGDLKTVIQRIRQRLSGLESTIKPNTSRLMMSRVGFRALRWPFQSREIDKIILDITQDETLILSFLQADQKCVLTEPNFGRNVLTIHPVERSAMSGRLRCLTSSQSSKKQRSTPLTRGGTQNASETQACRFSLRLTPGSIAIAQKASTGSTAVPGQASPLSRGRLPTRQSARGR